MLASNDYDVESNIYSNKKKKSEKQRVFENFSFISLLNLSKQTFSNNKFSKN